MMAARNRGFIAGSLSDSCTARQLQAVRADMTFEDIEETSANRFATELEVLAAPIRA